MIFEKKILNYYKSMTFVRNDDNGNAYLFSAKDFPDLKQESFTFTTALGNKLQGYLYSYDNPRQDKLIIFEHGMGMGHRAYLREVETIAKAGYLVLTYDHTGCMESEGRDINGMGGSLADLDSCIKAVKADSRFEGKDLVIIGHSWGGYSSLNITALHPDIKKIAAMSGFISVKHLVEQFFGGALKPYVKPVFELERRANPKTVHISALETLKNSDAELLIIHSEDDNVVSCKNHFEVLRNALGDRKNITFWSMTGKRHNPNYTKDAVDYKDNEYLAVLNKKLKKGELKTTEQKKAFTDGYDWWRMTEQDMDVWNKIFEFIR